MTKNIIIGFLVYVILSSSAFAAKGSCDSAKNIQLARNAVLQKACRGGITLDLSVYQENTLAICPSQVRPIDLIEKALIDICADNAEELKSKLGSVQIVTLDNQELQFKTNGKTIIVNIIKDEDKVLSRWSEYTEKFKNYIKESTGLPLLSFQEKESLALKKAANEKKDLLERSRLEKENQKNASSDKRKAAEEKFKAAQQAFQSKNASIWAKPGNSPADLNQKKKESEAAQAEFVRASEEYKKEMEDARK